MEAQEIQSKQKLLALKRRELKLKRERQELERVLPHLYVPMYPWQREIYESENSVTLLSAANQIGKSSILIRRAIADATDPERWKRIWGEGVEPAQIWYFYPDSSTTEKEIETKWIKEWLPREHMKNDGRYGWTLISSKGQFKIKFNAGPTIFFQYYSKKASALQASTVYEIFADEELPLHLYDELMFRLMATSGPFLSGFTPTLNQLYWRRAMEGDTVLPDALKRTISMYDCLFYEDGSPSRVMTIDKIKLAEAKCKSEVEVQRRVHGKFVTESGRTFYGFDYDTNVVKPYDIKNWTIYASVDYGSGPDMEAHKQGRKNHPAAIIFLAVRPDYRKGAVFKAWRGDGIKTTAGDVFEKYLELSKDLPVVQACYDPSAVDFGTIAARNGVSFTKANKTRDEGEDLLNTLFKYGLLDVFDDDGEILKLATELLTIMVANQSGSHKKDDDLADALRYGAKLVPWDLSVIDELVKKNRKSTEPEKKAGPMTEQEYIAQQIRERRGDYDRAKGSDDTWDEIEDEFGYWNDQYG